MDDIKERLLVSSCATCREAKDRIEALEGALRCILAAEKFYVHVGYDGGIGGGNFVYAEAMRTDSQEFQAAAELLRGEAWPLT